MSKLSVSAENCHTWYLEDADSYSDISFLNIESEIYFFFKFEPNKSILSVLPGNWDTWYLEDADAD